MIEQEQYEVSNVVICSVVAGASFVLEIFKRSTTRSSKTACNVSHRLIRAHNVYASYCVYVVLD